MVTETRTSLPDDPPSVRSAPDRRGALAQFLLGPVSARTWRELGYLLLRVPLAVLAFVLTVSLGATSVFLVVTFIGLPLMACVVYSGRWWGRLFRSLSRTLLHSPVAAPPALVRPPGVFGWIGSGLRDRAGWRGLAYVFVSFPVIVVGAYAAVLAWGISLGTLAYPLLWSVLHPTVRDSHGVLRHSGAQFGSWYFDSWPAALLLAAMGLVAVFVLPPWITRFFVAVDRWLIAHLLGPTERDGRVQQLEQTRTAAVEGAAATLRRVERDLHDGTQAQLVAMAMNLSRARSRLAAGDSPGAEQLLDTAHATAKDALTGLRDVVRSIHPPSLDQGLDAALATLASRNGIPTELRTDISQRPSPGTETIGYFCVAELLANVTIHSGATHALVEVFDEPGQLVLRVRDNGHGGAHVRPVPEGARTGTGLAGLVERVSTVDGSLAIDSPAGGPTSVTVRLPT